MGKVDKRWEKMGNVKRDEERKNLRKNQKNQKKREFTL